MIYGALYQGTLLLEVGTGNRGEKVALKSKIDPGAVAM